MITLLLFCNFCLEVLLLKYFFYKINFGYLMKDGGSTFMKKKN